MVSCILLYNHTHIIDDIDDGDSSILLNIYIYIYIHHLIYILDDIHDGEFGFYIYIYIYIHVVSNYSQLQMI